MGVAVIRYAGKVTALAAGFTLVLLAGASSAHSQEDSADYALTLNTCELTYSGTDDTVMGQVVFKSGAATRWVEFDKGGYNDFEQGDSDTYHFSAPSGQVSGVRLRKVGNDDWCFTGPMRLKWKGRQALVDRPAQHTWITEDPSGYDEPNFTYPSGKLHYHNLTPEMRVYGT